MQGLNDLVFEAENITTDLDDDEIPHIHRNIEQLRKPGETFYNRSVQNDLKAAKLLGNKISYKLSVGLSKTLETMNVMYSPDNFSTNKEGIPSFLKNERSKSILSISNIIGNNTQNVSYVTCEAVKSDWQKTENINILNLLENSDKLPFGLTTETEKPQIANCDGENNRLLKPVLSREEHQYARSIGNYIDDRLMNNQSGYRHRKSLKFITDINSDLELAEISRLIERYCALQSENKPESNLPIIPELRHGSSDLSKAMLTAALTHLESEYLAFISSYSNNQVSSNDSLATVTSFVTRHLLGPQFSEFCFEDPSFMGSVPVWPVIFVCLRAGLYHEVISVARNASNNIGDFHTILHGWVTRGHLSADQTRKLVAEYKRHIRENGDGYQKIVYSMLTGCDGDDAHSTVIGNIDDFMWFQLNQLRRSSNGTSNTNIHSSSGQNFGIPDQSVSLDPTSSLSTFQKLITLQYGEQYFQASKQPFTYCRILLLCQLLEPAVAFLARFERLRCHAVQLALVLRENNMLLISNYDAPLLSRCKDDLECLNQLNIVRLVTLYTNRFDSIQPRYALDLFYMLSDDIFPSSDNVDQNESSEHRNGFIKCATNLAIRTGQFELLFGRLEDHNGIGGRSGLIWERYGSIYANNILKNLAEELKMLGRTEERCLALQLAGRFDEAAIELVEILAGFISLAADHPNATRLQWKTEQLLRQLSNTESESAELLKSVATVAKFVWLSNGAVAKNDIVETLVVLDETGLVPRSLDPNEVGSTVESFQTHSELVRSLFPTVLRAAMKTLRLAARCGHSSDRYWLSEIRRRAEALVAFSGQLPLRMSGDVYASLSQLEIEIRG